jgi:hypothetical protein
MVTVIPELAIKVAHVNLFINGCHCSFNLLKPHRNIGHNYTVFKQTQPFYSLESFEIFTVND